MSTKPNEIPLGGLGGLAGLVPGGGADHQAVEAHLAVQAAIRSYQVTQSDGKRFSLLITFPLCLKVRGHLAASIDPLGLNNMDREQARKMIIRSVTVDEKVC